MDDRITVAIRSFRRAGRVTTADVFPFASVWVPESQAADYRDHYGERVVAIPDDEDGNAARKSNAIIERCGTPWVLILDDDIVRIRYWEDGGVVVVGPEQLEQIIDHHFALAAEAGVRLWGIGQLTDPVAYDTFRPFAMLSPVLGPWHGLIEPVLRYDETDRVKGKEDYDFWLQNIMEHRKTLRANKYHYVRSGITEGGMVSMRSQAVEEAAVKGMQEKWGSRVFRPGGAAGKRSSTGQNTLNSIIKVPIKGC